MSATTCRYTFEQSVLEVVEGSACLEDSWSYPFIVSFSFSSRFSRGPRPNKDGYCTLIEELVSSRLQQNTFCLFKLYII